MSNHPRPIRRLAVGLAAAVAIVAPAIAVGGTASAADLPGFDKPNTLEPVIDVKFDPFVPVPLPCLGWWCGANPFVLPDYVAGFDNISSATSTYGGQVATPYYARITNTGFVKGGDVWSSFAVRGGEILAIEPVNSWRRDLVVSKASETATTSAPHAVSYLDDAWLVHDANGIGFGYAENMYVRVWVTGTGDAELVVHANEHVGVEYLGSPRPAGYRPAEITRSNNLVDFTV